MEGTPNIRKVKTEKVSGINTKNICEDTERQWAVKLLRGEIDIMSSFSYIKLV